MEKTLIGRKGFKLILSIAIVLLLGLVFIVSISQGVSSELASETSFAAADLTRTKSNIKVTLSGMPTLYKDYTKSSPIPYDMQEIIHVDLSEQTGSNGDDWIRNLADNFTLQLKYETVSDVSYTNKGYYNAGNGCGTDIYELTTQTQNPSISYSDEITLCSDGVTLKGKHYMNAGSNQAKFAEDGQIYNYYCPTHHKRTSSQIYFHYCTECKSSTGLVNSTTPATTCKTSSCKNCNKIFVTGSQCPYCGKDSLSWTTDGNGDTTGTCTNTSCSGRSKTFIDYYENTAVYCIDCSSPSDKDSWVPLEPSHPGTADEQYEIFQREEPINIGTTDTTNIGYFKLTISSMQITGTDWTGSPVTNKTIYSGGQPQTTGLLAGIYYISSIQFVLNVDIPYYSSYKYYELDVRSLYAQGKNLSTDSYPIKEFWIDVENPTITHTTFTGSDFSGGLLYNFSEDDFPLILSSSVSISDEDIASFLSNNLVGDAEYSSNINWKDRISLYKSSDPGEGFFAYCLQTGRAPFTFGRGIAGYNPTTSIATTVGGSTLYNLFEIVWYNDKKLTMRSENLQNSGTYYGAIFPKARWDTDLDESAYIVTVSGMDYDIEKALIYVKSIPGSSQFKENIEGISFGETTNYNSVYVQEFTVSPRTLRISPTEGYGLEMPETLSKRYVKTLVHVPLTGLTNGSPLPDTVIYYTKSGASYIMQGVLSEDGAFTPGNYVPGTTYYLKTSGDEVEEAYATYEKVPLTGLSNNEDIANTEWSSLAFYKKDDNEKYVLTDKYISGQEMYMVDLESMSSAESFFSVPDSLESSIWTGKMKGDADDQNYYNNDTVTLKGTAFVTKDEDTISLAYLPGKYEYLKITARLEGEDIRNNYRIEFGKYTNNVWTPYERVFGEDDAYLMPGEFIIVAPPLEIIVDETLVKSDYYYGELFDAKDLNAKALIINSDEVEYVENHSVYGNYYVFNGEWIIKIVNDPAQIKAYSDKNVVYVVASLFTVVETEQTINNKTQLINLIGSTGFVGRPASDDADCTYFRQYGDRLYATTNDYYLAYYVTAVPQNGSPTNIYCMAGVSAVWDVTQSGVTEIDPMSSEEERLIKSVVSFNMNQPFHIGFNRINVHYDLSYEFNDVVNPEHIITKYYDGTKTVYSGNYVVAEKSKDYYANEPVESASYVFYEFSGGNYVRTSDSIFSSTKTYYIKEVCKLTLSVDGYDPDHPEESSIHFKTITYNNVTYSTVLEYDLARYVKSVAYAGYQDANVSNTDSGIIPIIRCGEFNNNGEEIFLKWSEVSGTVSSEAENVIGSYTISESLSLNGVAGEINGKILPLELKINFLPDTDPTRVKDMAAEGYSAADYARPYDTLMGVAIRLKRWNDTDAVGTSMLDVYQIGHVTPEEDKRYYADYYYAYYVDRNNTRIPIGYKFYRDLIDFRVIPSEKDEINGEPVKFILVEITEGFLDTPLRKEGFDWQGEQNFGTWQFPGGDGIYIDFQKNAQNEIQNLVERNLPDFFYWWDDTDNNAISKVNGNSATAINASTSVNPVTDSMPTYYKLHLDYDYAITNYVLSYADSNKSFITLEITRATISAAEIDLWIADPVEGITQKRYLSYNAMEHSHDIVLYSPEYSYVTFFKHNQLNEFYLYDDTTGEFSGRYLVSDDWTLDDYLGKNVYQRRGWLIDYYVVGGVHMTDLRGAEIIENENVFDIAGCTSVHVVKADFNKDGEFLTVESFMALKDGSDNEWDTPITQITSLISSFTLAGRYTVRLTIPATTNYNSIDCGTFELDISPAVVKVYTTVASRKYMEEYDPGREISYNSNYVIFVDSQEELDTYKAYIDKSSGAIYYTEDTIPSNASTYEVYAYHNPYVLASGTYQAGVAYFTPEKDGFGNVLRYKYYTNFSVGSAISGEIYEKSDNPSDWVYDSAKRYIIYYGIQHENGLVSRPLETFGNNDTYAVVTNHIEEYLTEKELIDGTHVLQDGANIYGKEVSQDLPEVAIEISGAAKKNYRFVYPVSLDSWSFLYVWPQNLSLTIDFHQEQKYTGESMEPAYSVQNEDGDDMSGAVLSKHIAAYYYLDENNVIKLILDGFTSDDLKAGKEVDLAFLRGSEFPNKDTTNVNEDRYFIYVDETGSYEQLHLTSGGRFYYGSDQTNLISYEQKDEVYHYYYHFDDDEPETSDEIEFVQVLMLPYRREATWATLPGEEGEVDGFSVTVKDAYYYFHNDAGDDIYLYLDTATGKHFYYENNNFSGATTMLSEVITLNPAYKNECINVIDGKKIYLQINEAKAASSCSDVTEVYDVYGLNGNIGGYILRVMAKPDEANGCSPTNYHESAQSLMIFDVLRLGIKLDESKCTFDKNFDSNTFGSSNTDLGFDNYYIKDLEGSGFTAEQLKTKDTWGQLTILSYFYDNCAGREIGSMQGFVYNGVDLSSSWGIERTYADGANIIDAGQYIILIKARISDGQPVDGKLDARFAKDMTSNIYFVIDVTKQHTKFNNVDYENTEKEQYFIVYLSRTRSGDFKVGISADSALNTAGSTIPGVENVYYKTYDNADVNYGFTLIVGTQDGSAGQILSVTMEVSKNADMSQSEVYLRTTREYTDVLEVTEGDEVKSGEGDYYHSTTKYRNGVTVYNNVDDLNGNGLVDDSDLDGILGGYFYNYSDYYTITSDKYFVSGRNYYGLKTVSRVYEPSFGLTSDMLTFMKNCRKDDNGVSFYIRVTVNSMQDNPAYDSNYDTKSYVFGITIQKKVLDVYVVAKEVPEDDTTTAPELIEVDESTQIAYYKSCKYYQERNDEVEYRFTFMFEGWVGSDDESLFGGVDKYPVINWYDITLNSPAGRYYIYAQKGVNTKELTNYAFNFTAATSFEILKRQPKVEFSPTAEYQGRTLEPVIKRRGINGEDLDADTPGNLDRIDSDSWNIECVGVFTDKDLREEDRFTYWYKLVGSPEGEASYGSIPIDGLLASDVLQSNFTAAFRRVSTVFNVGIYLFKVSFGASTNYHGVEDTYFIFEITKASLTLYFFDSGSGNISRGRATKIYDKDPYNYPSFEVIYDGFLNADDTDDNRSVQDIQYLRSNRYDEDNPETTSGGINNIGLVNPYYVFVDPETGKELKNAVYTNIYERPINVQKDPTTGDTKPYYIMIVFSDTYGIAANYNITVEYSRNSVNNSIEYPELYIEQRELVVRYDATKSKIVKTYDGTTRVAKDSVSDDNYSFYAVPGIVKSGLIEGDRVLIDVNYNSSSFARKDVFEQSVDLDGNTVFLRSEIIVTIAVNNTLKGEQGGNYKLHWDKVIVNGHEEDAPHEVLLRGIINQAKATVQFFSDEAKRQQARSSITVTYSGEPQPVYTNVFGVAIYNDNNEIIGYETIRYTELYSSTEVHYEDIVPPKNCAQYQYALTILNETLEDRNYSPDTNTIVLIIDQADVEISFGGDAVQTFGNIGIGLSAIATGVGGYSQPLSVAYFRSYQPRTIYNDQGNAIGYADDLNGFSDLITDIATVGIGVYYVRAIYEKTVNFRSSFAYEEFTVLPRETMYNYDKFSTEYPYTGSAPEIEFYILYEEGRIVPPQLLFNALENGRMTPYNYKVVDGVITDITDDYPVESGRYQVRPYDFALKNFIIKNSTWLDFTITKVDVTVSVENVTITVGESYTPSYSVVKSSTKEDISSLIGRNVLLEYYNVTTGETTVVVPTAAGTYRVTPKGVALTNYNVTVKSGILVINNSEVEVAVSGGSGSSAGFKFSGSIASDFKPTITEVQNVEESEYQRRLDSFKETMTEYAGYYLSNVFEINYETMVVSFDEDSGFEITLTVPDLIKLFRGSSGEEAQNAARMAYAADEYCYVAVFYEDEMEIVRASILSDEEISFTPKSQNVRAVSVLTMEDRSAKNEKDIGWLMYLFIGLGVIALGLSLLLVIKRKG